MYRFSVLSPIIVEQLEEYEDSGRPAGQYRFQSTPHLVRFTRQTLWLHLPAAVRNMHRKFEHYDIGRGLPGSTTFEGSTAILWK